ncbi:MAG TPA: BON domain-containing protein, partial [Vicinamibacterales bacterium]|nr:BON domain-containing protein [Vicinamibacterales bacterium]
MKLSYMFVAAILIGGPSSVQPAFAQTKVAPASAKSDRAVEERIEKRVARDPSLKDFSIKVDVDHGVATLKGTVATDADRGKVAEIAKLSGATRVDNQLTANLDARTRAK